MENYNSNERNRVSNQTLDGSNLNFSNLSNGIEENEIDLNERSNYARGGIFITNFRGPSFTISDFVDGVTNTSSIPSENLSDNARNSRQMKNLWQAPTTSFYYNTHFHGASSMDFLENSTHSTFFEQHTNYHGGSSSASTNQSSAFIHPSDDQVRYLREHGLEDTGRDVYFLRHNIDSQSPSLVSSESVASGIIMVPGHRDDSIIIETLLALQEHIGGIETGFKKNVISKLLKQSKYQSSKMKNYSESCCICLDTYDDGAELGKINCGHKFHYQCIRRWLKRNNSCPIYKSIALTP
ncbi:hypothetical protein R3W88_011467 [Solanum pinnatisectum]|uniref:RING-type E3 ubiquitin transferase n=1 Tax=Solanum pinnatisectum TaxID=50273 RepID=A0AAV9L8T8_9SOLN|nr:hypothetical protein R3W88_011467 [Solanum pinnatisectum]